MGYWSLGEGDGHMTPSCFYPPTKFFKNGLGPVHETSSLVTGIIFSIIDQNPNVSKSIRLYVVIF